MMGTTDADPIMASPIIRRLSANGSNDAEIGLNRSLAALAQDATSVFMSRKTFDIRSYPGSTDPDPEDGRTVVIGL